MNAHVEPAHTLQSEVEDDQVDPIGGEPLQCCRFVGGLTYLEVVVLEQQPQQEPDRVVVLDAQDST